MGTSESCLRLTTIVNNPVSLKRAGFFPLFLQGYGDLLSFRLRLQIYVLIK